MNPQALQGRVDQMPAEDLALGTGMSLQYYQRAVATNGADTPVFFTNTFDGVTPLVDWVERDVAPDSIPAARVIDGKVVRTRPLCPYPMEAQWKGTGNADEAANSFRLQPFA